MREEKEREVEDCEKIKDCKFHGMFLMADCTNGMVIGLIFWNGLGVEDLSVILKPFTVNR